MKPHWHPTSALLLPDVDAWCSPALIRLPLRAGQVVELRYLGDRMWPSFRHGQTLQVRTLEGPARRGQAVVALVAGIPELLRVVDVKNGQVLLSGDADPAAALGVAPDELLGNVGEDAAGVPGRWARRRRRCRLDVAEAFAALEAGDEAETVRRKYDSQAGTYAATGGEEIDPALLARVRTRLDQGGRLLVAGSGAGRECFGLARAGFEVTGVDFASSMVEQARRVARERGLAVDFVSADLRRHEEPADSLDAVLFTYDVYSFLPRRSERVALLRRMRRWLRRGGVVYLSARVRAGAWAAVILTLQWLRAPLRRAWGDSHTRYMAPDGSLRRSFVHYFGRAGLARELARGGFEIGHRLGGHVELQAREPR